MKTNILFAIGALALSTSAFAVDTAAQRTVKELNGFGADLCGKFGLNAGSLKTCDSNLEAFVKANPWTETYHDTLSYKLKMTQALCAPSSNSKYAEDCWEKVSKAIINNKKSSPELFEAFRSGFGACATVTERFIGSRTDVDVTCMTKSIGDAADARVNITPQPLQPRSSQASEEHLRETHPADRRPTSSEKDACELDGTLSVADRGTEILVDGKPPLGAGTKLIAYSTGITIQTPPAEAHTYFKFEGGWAEANGNPALKKVSEFTARNVGLFGNTFEIFGKKIRITYDENRMSIKRTDIENPTTVEVSTRYPNVVSDKKREKLLKDDPKHELLFETGFDTHVVVRDSKGDKVGEFSNTFPAADIGLLKKAREGIDTLPKDQRKTARDAYYGASRTRMFDAARESANITDGSVWHRDWCRKPELQPSSRMASSQSSATDGRSGGTEPEAKVATDAL